ncbi:phage portal protein [Sedimentitalea sp. JM2-8]|uniref:Phage portal protein n=1 Tax=Sedimentitalea xiamensis TaxID=3050037 RepID=A0ABT7FG30_9RHOB|nr:phage portal protein [Sedimentitalea xiamensis]MDK3074104.1 phage portal protein [Sedimentitalea xiamensis]
MAGEKRGYSAAQTVARYGDFIRSSGSADYELSVGLAEVRRKARFLARNSGTVRRYIQLMQDNIVGERGFTLQSGNTRVEQAWSDWCERPTVDGVMHMVDFERQMIATWCRDGEFLFEIVQNSKYRDMVALNPLEPDMLDETLNTTDKITGNQIKMGVEIDALGVPVAYHLLTEHPGDMLPGHTQQKNRHRRVLASNIVHVYERLRPGQTRGEPPAAAMVNAVKMLDGYREAETMNRRIAAAMMGFFSRDMPKADGIAALADGTETGGDDEQLFTMNVEPGTLKQLPDGMRFDKFDPGGSQTDYHSFEAQVKKDIAMSAGISTFALGMETAGVSYSTGRSVIQEDRDFYKGKQGFFIRMAMKPIFRRWARMHALSGGSSIAPTRLATTVKDAKFRGRGWTWIDPAKDISANAEALETYQTSYTQIAADRGMDVRDLFAEIQRDNELMSEFGLQRTSQNSDDGGQNDIQQG